MVSVGVQRRAPVEIVDVGAIALHRHHLALGAGDRPWRGGNFRPQPAARGGRLFLSFAAGWGSHTQEFRELVNRYEQGRTNAATLAN